MPRLRWNQLPPHLRATVQDALDTTVVADQPQMGGYSPSMASRLGLADGRAVFAKAVSAEQNPHSPGLYRHET